VGQELTCCWKEIGGDRFADGRPHAMHAPEIDGKLFVNDFPEEMEPQRANLSLPDYGSARL